MKQILFILIALLNAAFAQQPLSISTDKTTSLIFPFPIKYVDRGTRDILVQPVKEDERILLVKAASKQFAETNHSKHYRDQCGFQSLIHHNSNRELVAQLPESYLVDP